MQPIHRIDPGARMSEAVIYNGKIYSCGVVADSTVGHSVEAQMHDVLAQIDALLARAGSNKTHILKATIWLANMDDFDAMNAVWDAWVTPGQAPARATVEAKLANPGWAVEIMIEAACG